MTATENICEWRELWSTRLTIRTGAIWINVFCSTLLKSNWMALETISEWKECTPPQCSIVCCVLAPQLVHPVANGNKSYLEGRPRWTRTTKVILMFQAGPGRPMSTGTPDIYIWVSSVSYIYIYIYIQYIYLFLNIYLGGDARPSTSDCVALLTWRQRKPGGEVQGSTLMLVRLSGTSGREMYLPHGTS